MDSRCPTAIFYLDSLRTIIETASRTSRFYLMIFLMTVTTHKSNTTSRAKDYMHVSDYDVIRYFTQLSHELRIARIRNRKQTFAIQSVASGGSCVAPDDCL